MFHEKNLTAVTITQRWLRLLDFGGCNPQNQTRFKRILSFSYVILNGLIIFLMLLHLLFTKFESIVVIGPKLIIILGCYEIFVKFLVTFNNVQTLSKMLEMIKYNFWPLENTSPASCKRLQKIYQTTNMAALCHFYNIFINLIGYFTSSVLVVDKGLPMNIWIPDEKLLRKSPYYEIIVFVEMFLLSTSVIFCFIPIDALFITMIATTYCQFEMLAEKMLTIGNHFDQNYQVLRDCAAHHNVLLSFLQMFEEVFSNAILPVVYVVLFIISLSMYIVVTEQATSSTIVYTGIMAGLYVQLYFYCLAGQLIYDEGKKIGDAVYSCNWLNVKSRNVKLGLILIILRSQNTRKLTAGGVMSLSLESFTKMARLSLSLLTFFKKVK